MMFVIANVLCRFYELRQGFPKYGPRAKSGLEAISTGRKDSLSVIERQYIYEKYLIR